ncbi:sporulation integral membrane protein YtvI [Priestia megaterium]|uniref:Sporulation integral membrane protein YtvI n=1 Tax=Priestia megaterium TaxID=1404 RepID=A0A6M6EBC9_PRIMG|nr:sporulation integral membrane protein YtvI [Priestia megaterium]QJX80835.1 sporulation integral membrane protein YtvI [Priestia megaterium]
MLHYLKDHWKKFLNVGLFIVALFIFFYLLKLSFLYAAPIYFALAFYAIYRPFINWLNKKGLSYKLATGISITVISLIIVGLFASLGTLLFFQAQNVAHNLPKWVTGIESFIHSYINSLKSQINQVPDSVTESAKEQLNSVGGKVGEWTYSIITALFTNVSLITKVLTQIIIGYVLSIFLAFEWPRLQRFLSKSVPNDIKKFTTSVFGDTVKGIGSFIKAQLVLVTYTFIIVCVALLILRVENALLLGFISGIFDVLPLLGVSTLFVPWIIYLFIIGKTTLAIELTVLWVIVMAFRQVMEPRLTGNSLGISPFLMLAGMVVSVAVLGFIGIILAPVILVVIKSLWEKGYFHLWLLKEGTSNKIQSN